jgi:hypothetical protein
MDKLLEWPSSGNHRKRLYAPKIVENAWWPLFFLDASRVIQNAWPLPSVFSVF